MPSYQVNRDDLTRYVANTSAGVDVFPEKELAEWAENNGFVREEAK